jgi:hypothetical protein
MLVAMYSVSEALGAALRLAIVAKRLLDPHQYIALGRPIIMSKVDAVTMTV